LLKQKNEERQRELESFNTKATNKQDLFKELKEMDSKIKAKPSNNLDQRMQEIEGNSQADKRLAMYKNLRDQVVKELAPSEGARLQELERKIKNLEESQPSGGGLLDGIKAYKVEDM